MSVLRKAGYLGFISAIVSASHGCRAPAEDAASAQMGGIPKKTDEQRRKECNDMRYNYEGEMRQFQAMSEGVEEIKAKIKACPNEACKIQEQISLGAVEIQLAEKGGKVENASNRMSAACKDIQDKDMRALQVSNGQLPSQGCYVFKGKTFLTLDNGSRRNLGNGSARIPVYVHQSNGGNVKITPKAFAANCQTGWVYNASATDFVMPTESEKVACNKQCK